MEFAETIAKLIIGAAVGIFIYRLATHPSGGDRHGE